MDGEDLSVRLASLSPAKRALLELKLQQKRTEHVTAVTIPRRNAQAVASLSFAQQRLWFLSQLEPENCTYNETSALRLDGELNINALHGALNAIVERHEVLRTTYAIADDGVPVQIVNAVQTFDLPVLDISELTGSQQDAEVQRLALELKTRPFDLSNDMPLRMALIRLSPFSHVLVTVKQHIASDGWSSGVFSRELATFYQRFNQGETTPLPELPIQYADYAVWQREWLKGEVLEKQLAYWKGQLEDVPILNLPTDRPRGASAKDSGAKKSLRLPKTLIDRLKALSSQQGVTPFMTLLAAFQVLLHRYTGQDDIAVGSPIAGRTRAETEGLIGFFVNTLVLRTKLADNPKFNELLARVRNTALQAYEHQDIPFEKLVEELNPERHQNQTPFFQVMFAVQNVPRSQLEMTGLKIAPVEVASSTAKFDLSTAFIEREGEILVRIEYRPELFNGATIERQLGHFRNLLEGIVANPEWRISELPLLTEPEKHQLLVEWNETKADYPKDKCIHELFEIQVEKTPDAVALVFEDQQLTYRELNNRANQVANYLQKLGVGPEVLVGICVEHSIKMVVELLGILKAGGGYLPLDPSYPKERLGFMLEDTRAGMILTDMVSRSSLPPSSAHVICLDRAWEEITKEPQANTDNESSANSLAYVIYTSGSTGLPKGVQITHESLLNLVFWHHQAFSVTPVDRTTQIAGPGFDAAVWELWPYLTVGASIHIPDEMTRLDAASLRDWLVAHAITISFVPTALAESLVTLDWPQQTALRILLTGGDTLHVYPPDTLPFRVFNNYGPTECTVVSTSAQVWPNTHTIHLPTIGRPIANTQVYILDAYLNAVPIGVIGELYVGGDGIARGYLNQPELTAEKFIVHSVDGEAAKRLYKTGDRVCYLPDGNIEFLGRIDNQVKIRGFRIELGEIEAVLGQHPAVREAVVLARETGDPTASPRTDMRLVAYVVASLDTPTNELRTFLQQKLPEYMVPSTFVILKSLPLTLNGKVDRKALPTPDQSRPEQEETYVAPRTAVEEVLAGIWAKVLKVEKVGVRDNFFELGGHSLKATQVNSRLCTTFKIEFPVRGLFENPTVESLARAVLRIEPQARRIERIAQLHQLLKSLSPEEVQRMLRERGQPKL